MYEKLVEIITYPYFIFQRILDATGYTGLFLGAIGIVLVYRLLIKPLTGSRFDTFMGKGSDSVVRHYDKLNNKD